MSHQYPFQVFDQLGIQYRNALVEVPATESGAVTDVAGRVYPVQASPRLAIDGDGGASVSLALVDVDPNERIELSPISEAVFHETIGILRDDAYTVIANGDLSVRLPVPGLYAYEAPGPFAGFKLDNGEWVGSSTLKNVPGHVRVAFAIESQGSALVQWLVSYRWGSLSGIDYRMRWACGSDTFVVEETVLADSGAYVEIEFQSPNLASAHHRGAGERLNGLEPMGPKSLPGVPVGSRFTMGHLAHISYFGQWRDSWVGFGREDEPLYVGVFGGWSSKWINRGKVRPEIVRDAAMGDLLCLPARAGRRIWGVLLTTRDVAFAGDGVQRHPLNLRKNHFSDVPLSKQMQWVLDGPLEARRTHLLAEKDLYDFRARLDLDPDIPRALKQCLVDPASSPEVLAAAGFWANDPDRIAAAVAGLRSLAAAYIEAISYGGYDRICIFDGRASKRQAYDLDAYWALGLVADDDYRAIRRGLLALAYVYRDADYCRYEDFRLELDPPSEGVREAMADEMGDSPVPPNFAAEFLTTTAVMAELFPTHPLHDDWRAFGDSEIKHFLDRWFEPDGTYLESINYHNHCFNELLCALYPAIVSGRIDYRANPRFRGSLEHFLAMRMPMLSSHLPSTGHDGRVWASQDTTRATPMPADGNSGGFGNEQNWGAQLSVGAWLYRDLDPAFAGKLMAAWRESGKPVVDYEHPVLTMLTLDPSIQSVDEHPVSAHRASLGVVSRGYSSDDELVWSLFRAGRCTHHMDFDQGNIHLAVGDEVLLGDHGYHTEDDNGHHISGAHSFLHNTVTFGVEVYNSTAYTGLEHAPEPTFVETNADFDYVVHKMITTNLRRMDELSYNHIVPIEPVEHIRHYLFVKTGYIVVWDVLTGGDMPTVFRLHPTKPMIAVAPGAFVAGETGRRLLVQFVTPREPRVIENRQWGPLWSFAASQPAGESYLTVLRPQSHSKPLDLKFHAPSRKLIIEGDDVHDTIVLPPSGAGALPILVRT